MTLINYNNDNVMRASLWFESFGWFILMSRHMIYGRGDVTVRREI